MKISRLNPGGALLMGHPDGVEAGMDANGKLLMTVTSQGTVLVVDFEDPNEARGTGVGLIGGAALLELRQQALAARAAGRLVQQ